MLLENDSRVVDSLFKGFVSEQVQRARGVIKDKRGRKCGEFKGKTRGSN